MDKYLNYMCTVVAKVWPHRLQEIKQCETEFHLYLIVSRESAYFEKDTEITDKGIFNCHIKCGTQSYTFDYQMPSDAFNAINKDSISVDNSRSKFRFAATIDDCQKQVFFDANELLVWYFRKKQINYDYQIDYIGQSFGVEGNRTADIRLSNHETLQRLLSENEANGHSRWYQIIMPSFEYIDINSHFGCIGVFQDSILPVEAQINLQEAFLINYFKPRYNEKFVNGVVPSNKHKSYKTIIDERYNSFIVSAGIEGMNYSVTLRTDHNAISIDGGILKKDIIVDFQTANTIDPEHFYYSFMQK